MYNQRVMEIFANPKNVGMIKCADGVGEAEEKVCGDVVKLYIKVEDNVISEIKFKALGGVSTIASAYALTEVVKNKTLEEAMQITDEEILNILGELPEDKMYSIALAKNALVAVVEDYAKNLEKELKKLENNKK